MIRNFDTVLTTLNGEEFKDADGPLTLKSVCVNVIGTPLKGDDQMDIVRKFDLYKLADRINKGGDVEISAEEIATLKARLAATGYSILVAGKVVMLLES